MLLGHILCLRPAGGRVAVPARGENRAPPPGSASETNNDRQVKFELIQLKLLYEIGRVGNFDIGDNFSRIIADRTAKVFAQQNTTTISENRERLSSALRALLGTDLARLYGIEVVDFQIAQITYSDSFRASVEAAVKAKNEAVAAETRSTASASRRSRR